MRKIVIGIMLIMMTSGCTSITPETQEGIKEGIVDACYTVMEYSPKDSKERIKKYLNSKISSNSISKEEGEMIERCLHRTESSSKWVK